MHSDHLYCRDRCRCRKSIILLCVALSLVIIGVLMGMHAVNRKVEALKETAAQAIVASTLEHDAFRAKIDERIAESEKRSHGLRVALADELRRETKISKIEALSAIAAESVIRGQQITGERAQRRKEDGALAQGLDNAFDALKFHQVELEKLTKRLNVLDKLWLNHKCPEPCKCVRTPLPPVPPKVMPPPVAPLSQVYTIPYPWFYEKPRCR